MLRSIFLSVRWQITLLTLLGMAHSAGAQTWIQWPRADGGNDHYYALTPTTTNWDAAERLAVSWGGHLATITSSKEQDFINDTFLTGPFEHLPLWIGLVDKAPKGTLRWKFRQAKAWLGFPTTNRFEWVTGEALDYKNWKPGEPNNSPPGEYYVAINWEYSDDPPRGIKGDWNDAPLDGTSKYGGATSGPYFGVVERDTLKPPLWAYASILLWLALGAGLVFIFIFLRVRSRKRAGSAADNPP